MRMKHEEHAHDQSQHAPKKNVSQFPHVCFVGVEPGWRIDTWHRHYHKRQQRHMTKGNTSK